MKMNDIKDVNEIDVNPSTAGRPALRYRPAPQFEHILRASREYGNPLDVMTPETVLNIRRARDEESQHFLQALTSVGVRDFFLPTEHRKIPTRIYTPAVAGPNTPTLVFFHGGGWTLGSLQTHHNIAAGLAMKTPAIVVSVDYRLAPESPFPAGLDDAFAAVEWIAKNAHEIGGHHSRIGVAGDSAGANLATVVARRAPKAGIKIAFQALLYPSTDLSHFETASHEEFGDGHLLTNESLRRFRDFYLKEPALAMNPDVSPLLAAGSELARLPPSLILVAGCDPLREEGVAYAKKLAKNGVRVKLQVMEDMIHGFLRFYNTDAKATSLVESILDDISREIDLAFKAV